jgi:hypothetical protein
VTSLPPLTEAQLQEKTTALAHARGWLVHHDRPAPDPRQGGALRTVIDGDKGFPDLVLARGGRIIIAELKSEKGRTSQQQEQWLDALGVNTYPSTVTVTVWRPRDWPDIERALR